MPLRRSGALIEPKKSFSVVRVEDMGGQKGKCFGREGGDPMEAGSDQSWAIDSSETEESRTSEREHSFQWEEDGGKSLT